jgi:hypothetical protein
MPLLCYLVDKNPNDVTGGGGTLAGEMQDADAKGPFFVWPAQEFESAASPHAVVAASEVEHMYAMLHGRGEVLAGAETVAHDEPAEVAAAERHQPESPVYDLNDSGQARAFLEAFGHEA